MLELPGTNFAAYRWGNAIEPITPALMDRPYLAREVLPYGSPESALLLDALDRRLQNGVLDPASLAPMARLFGVGDVVVRSDLDYERFGVPSPGTVWSTVVDPRAPGLGPATTFGEQSANSGDARLDPLLPSHLRFGREVDRSPALAPVAVLPVDDAQDIVRLASVSKPVVLDGDGDGIVDAAAAGVIDGRSLVLESPALSAAQLDAAVERAARFVVTDSHRRRIQTWFTSLRDTRGPTEQAGELMVEPTGYDARLASFPDATDDERTVVEQMGARVTASSGGGVGRPEDRPVAAVDGRLETSWRVGGADPGGERPPNTPGAAGTDRPRDPGAAAGRTERSGNHARSTALRRRWRGRRGAGGRLTVPGRPGRRLSDPIRRRPRRGNPGDVEAERGPERGERRGVRRGGHRRPRRLRDRAHAARPARPGRRPQR